MTRDRNVLTQLVKEWAQDHDLGHVINDPAPGDEGLSNTATYLSWVIQTQNQVLDLTSLVNKLEALLERRRTYHGPDGMFCCKCQTFYQFAEPNQVDGTLLCYSCRKYPY